jgi:RNA polymerase sigma factor (sigma-70 family)
MSLPEPDPEPDQDSGEESEVNHTSYERRPEHEAMLAVVFQMTAEEVLAALAVKRHTAPGFIASEVLVTLARAGFGTIYQVRDAIGLALNERIVRILSHFLLVNPEWNAVVSRSSEAKKEAVSFTQLRIFAADARVSFAEVTFKHFVDMRLLDWFRSQTRLKNKVPSVDGLRPPDAEDGEPLSLVEQIEDDVSLRPDEQAELNQLKERSQSALRSLPKKESQAVYFCIECEFTQQEAAWYMKCKDRSVRTYLKSALARLRNGDWYE